MQISWHGGFAVKIVSKDTIIVLDPYDPSGSSTPFRAKASIIGLSNPSEKSMSHTSGISGEHTVIDSPGEYSFGGITLEALGWFDDQNEERLLMRWEVEGMTIVYAGALNRALTDEELSHINEVNVDILILPVGNGSALNTKQALALVATLEPRMVIPTHFKIPAWKEKLNSVEQFAKEMGISGIAAEKKINVRPNKLPQDDVQTVILKP